LVSRSPQASNAAVVAVGLAPVVGDAPVVGVGVAAGEGLTSLGAGVTGLEATTLGDVDGLALGSTGAGEQAPTSRIASNPAIERTLRGDMDTSRGFASG
jgi:hypothetical protein